MNSYPTVAKLLAERLDLQPEAVTPDTELLSLGADSLTVIELIFDLEDEFDVKLGDERPNLLVVRDIADFIDRYVQLKAAG